MAKKKAKKKNTGPAQPMVRLSQCMIVKNEEKNIEKALSWAKGAAFEQIVVDTGSTDRTVELAEKMGAKVYHFKWVDDFSAAKNYAMDQAKGNWIAILDADEYMPREDVKELITMLKKIQSSPELLREYDSLNCSWLQLDDEGITYAVLTQQRIFQNRSDLRYEGKIHEAVKLRNKYVNAEKLRIMHTGYAQKAFNEADKRERNIKLLRDEYERNPDSPHIMLYLADSIKSSGTEEARSEAEQLYLKALASDKPAEPAIKRLAYDFLLPRYSTDDDKTEEALELCNKAIADLPNHIDYYYYRALLQNKKGSYKESREDLLKCEKVLMTSQAIPETRILLPSPILLYHQLSISARGLEDEQAIIKYDSIIHTMLEEGKDQTTVLGPYLVTLFQQGKTGTEVFDKLLPVYDPNKPQDLMLVARAAKDYGIVVFAQRVMDLVKGLI